MGPVGRTVDGALVVVPVRPVALDRARARARRACDRGPARDPRRVREGRDQLFEGEGDRSHRRTGDRGDDVGARSVRDRITTRAHRVVDGDGDAWCGDLATRAAPRSHPA